MERNKSQFARLMELDRQVRAGKYPNCLTFAKEWEVSQKTIQRDIDYLKYQLDAPLAYDRVRKGFCYTDLNWFLPSVSLSEGELFALLVAGKAMEQYQGTPVSGELERIFGKMMGGMTDKITVQPELVFSRFSFTAPPARPVALEIWKTVVRGLAGQKMIKILYQSQNAAQAKQHLLSPYHIANLQGEWYVFGHSDVDGELRQFALARIQKAQLTERFFERPQDFDAKELLRHTFGRFVGSNKPYTIRLLFPKEAVGWVQEREWHRGQKLRPRAHGAIELEFKAHGLFEVFRWVLAWGRNVRVLEPKELRDKVRAEIAAMQQNYG
jgi:predicted DNA-binding transcriptional regulator YafY